MAFKKFRKMKVYESSGYNYKSTPSIILKGDWLKEIGFDSGGLIQVECENGKLIITPRELEVVEYHTP
jgi:toxic protein SymE